MAIDFTACRLADFGENYFQTPSVRRAGRVGRNVWGPRHKLMRDSSTKRWRWTTRCFGPGRLQLSRRSAKERIRPGVRPELGYRCFEPFDPSSVHFDDIAAKVREDQDHHNRVALILQGLLDRSRYFTSPAVANLDG